MPSTGTIVCLTCGPDPSRRKTGNGNPFSAFDDDDDSTDEEQEEEAAPSSSASAPEAPAIMEVLPVAVSRTTRARFERDGFVLVDAVLPPATVDALRARLEAVLRGEYDTGVAPHRAPKPGGGKLASASRRTVHVVDAARADSAFAKVVRSPALAELAAKVAGWPGGARVANDQVWAKPPGCGGLVFHRDAPYFDEILPRSEGRRCAVVTAWLALDDMRDDAIGPLRYVGGSHGWGDDRRGTARVFFAKSGDDGRGLVRDAAERAGAEYPDETAARVPAGGAGIHDGRCWHGSGPNATRRPRRGLGVHFVPAVATFDPSVPPDERGGLWQPARASVALASTAVAFAESGGAAAYARRCAAADAALRRGGAEAALLRRPAILAGLDAVAEGRLAAASRAALAACFARGTRWHRRPAQP